MKSNIQKALDIAYKAHKGHKTWSGNPYIFHPIRIMEKMDTEEEKCVALLHDVVEDTDITLKQLEEQFDPGIVNAVGALTHNEEDTYDEYIEKMSWSSTAILATKVKIADLKDNMRIERVPILTQKTLERLIKYKETLKYLQGL